MQCLSKDHLYVVLKTISMLLSFLGALNVFSHNTNNTERSQLNKKHRVNNDDNNRAKY